MFIQSVISLVNCKDCSSQSRVTERSIECESVMSEYKKVCSRRESNPRPLVHKTSALPIELRELAQILCYKIYFYTAS